MKGPALTTGTYVDNRGVSAYRQVLTPPSVVTAASPVLLVTSHRSGTRTVIPNAALRSGWSKQAKTQRASSGSKEVQTYTSPSFGSTARWIACPAEVRRCTVRTTSTLSAARSGTSSCPPGGRPVASGRPLSVASSTSPRQSTNVVSPGVAAENVIVEVVSRASPSIRTVSYL